MPHPQQQQQTGEAVQQPQLQQLLLWRYWLQHSTEAVLATAQKDWLVLPGSLDAKSLQLQTHQRLPCLHRQLPGPAPEAGRQAGNQQPLTTGTSTMLEWKRQARPSILTAQDLAARPCRALIRPPTSSAGSGRHSATGTHSATRPVARSWVRPPSKNCAA
jgi:hypothetical protein